MQKGRRYTVAADAFPLAATRLALYNILQSDSEYSALSVTRASCGCFCGRSEQLCVLALRPLRFRSLLERPDVVPRREVEFLAVEELLDGQDLKLRVASTGRAGVEPGAGGLAEDGPRRVLPAQRTLRAEALFYVRS